MPRATPRERGNVALLAANQAPFLVAAITVMTLNGLVVLRLTPNPALATLPVAMMMVGVVIAALPASLLMKPVGRRTGFVVGALLGGIPDAGPPHEAEALRPSEHTSHHGRHARRTLGRGLG